MGASIAVFRGMYLDLGQIKAQLADARSEPAQVTLYADVVSIPDGLTWVAAGSALIIIARRLESAGTARVTLDYRTSQTSSFVVFADQVAGTVTVQGVVASSPNPTSFTVDPTLASEGVRFHAANGTPVATPLNRAQGLPIAPTDTFVAALNTSFLFASLLYDTNPPLALDLFQWVQNWSAPSPDLLGIYLRSSSMVALLSSQLNARRGGATFVPYLSASVYTQLAKAFVDQATQIETKYLALSTQKVLTDEGIQYAQALCDNAQYQSQYVAGLRQQSQDNYNGALAALNSALANFKAQKLTCDEVGIDFKDIGVTEYERAAIAKAIFTLAAAVVTFAVAIGTMLVGQEEVAAPAAAAGAAEVAEGVAATAGTASEIAQLAKELAAVMKTIKKIVEVLQKVATLANAILSAAGDISKATAYVAQMQNLNLDQEDADLTASDQWEIFRLKADAVLEDPVKKGIQYAAEYRQALDILAIYGQSLAAAQVSLVKASQDYAGVLLQVNLAQQQQQRLQQYVTQLQVGEAPIVDMMQNFYLRYLDAKSSLYAALQNYRAAYFYWALTPSSVQPKIADPVSDLDAGLTSLTSTALDQTAALAHFDPPPETITNKTYVVTDAPVLQALRNQQKATFTLPLGDEDFLGLRRVRLTTVRAWLEGAKPAQNQRISVQLTTSGNYRDGFQKINYQFVSKPLTRVFEYHVQAPQGSQPSPAWTFDDRTLGYIEVDGRVDDEVKYAYFQPTPFTEWTVTVDPVLNPRIDLSQVSKLTLQFQGSAIGAY